MEYFALQKFEPKSIRTQVAMEIENRIFSGDLKVGERLPSERELAHELGVSRSLVNLAILDLESIGFLKTIPRQGTFVADYKNEGTPQMLLSLMVNGVSNNTAVELFTSLMETRILLENECAKRAAENATDSDLELLSNLLEQMRAAKEPAQFSEANFRFHRALMAASGNIVYAMIFQSFELVIRYYVSKYFTSTSRMRVSVSQHENLLKALVEHDASKASEAVQIIMHEGITRLNELFGKKRTQRS
ncbi:MAG TPA: FadR/GntR family transcriptional regulator [Clostridia bacterium]|nr:FadR/GntR family transcriptional regulator [Clostridia bacterium]